MSVSFWAHKVKPGHSQPLTTGGILELSHVTLLEDPQQGKTIIKIKSKGHTFNLCTLERDAVECQSLSHTFIAEDKAILLVEGANAVNVVGQLIVFNDSDDEMSDLQDSQQDQDDDVDEDDEDNEQRETITGEPRYADYLSDLLGPDLPDDDDDDYELDDDDEADDFGTTAFRDPTDNEFLGGFELRHFNLAPNIPGYDAVDLRQQEKDMEDSLLHDNIATGLVNALLNSGDDFQIQKGRGMLKKLKKQRKHRLEQQKTL